MARKTDTQEQVTAFPSAHAGFALASQTDSLALANATRDFYLIIFNFVRARPAQRDRSRRSVQRLFQCDHDIGFDIGPALGRCLTSAKSAKCRAAAAATEKRFEKVAESGATELELNSSSAVAAPLIVSAFSWLRTPLWRRLETARLIPIRAGVIVLFPFFWIG